MVNVSIIILNWNTARDTIECLESIKKQSYKDYEIVLVDNGSEENDFAALKNYVKKFGKKVRLFRLKKNIGFTGGSDYGLSKARGNYMLFLNNDTIVDKKFIVELLAPFKKYENVGATVPKLLFYKDGPTKKLQHGGSRLTYYGMAVDEGLGRTDSRIFDREKEDGCITGACFMISRKVFDALDEAFCTFYFTYFEEVDLSWRMRSAGFRIMYVPKSIVYHKGSVSIKVNRRISTQDMFSIRNKYLTYYRNLPKYHFAAVLPIMVLYDIGRMGKHTLKGNPAFIVNFAAGLGKFIRERHKVKTPRRGKLSDLSW
jgi:GT2 family glycosyltransferase